MRWVFPLPMGARFFVGKLFTLVVFLQLATTETWAGVRETAKDLPPLATPLSLTIVWYDTYNLLPKSFEPMKREVNRLFGEVGVHVRWKRGETVVPVDDFADSLSVNVVLLPSDPAKWGLGGGVMGLATHRPGFKGAVYIFRLGILRTLGLGRLGDTARLPGGMAGFARAVARVVAHEVIHFVMPRYPHTKAGLMKETLNRVFLMRPGVHIDGASSKALAAELAVKTFRMLAATHRERRNPAVATDLRW